MNTNGRILLVDDDRQVVRYLKKAVGAPAAEFLDESTQAAQPDSFRVGLAINFARNCSRSYPQRSKRQFLRSRLYARPW